MIIKFNSESIRKFVEKIKDPNPIHRQENPILPMDFVSSHLSIFYKDFTLGLNEPFVVDENKDYGLHISSKDDKISLGEIETLSGGVFYKPTREINLKKPNTKKLEKIINSSSPLSVNDVYNVERLENLPYLTDNDVSKTILGSTYKIVKYLNFEDKENINAIYRSHSVIGNNYGVEKDKIYIKELKDKGKILTFIFPTPSKEYLVIKELYIQK